MEMCSYLLHFIQHKMWTIWLKVILDWSLLEQARESLFRQTLYIFNVDLNIKCNPVVINCVVAGADAVVNECTFKLFSCFLFWLSAQNSKIQKHEKSNHMYVLLSFSFKYQESGYDWKPIIKTLNVIFLWNSIPLRISNAHQIPKNLYKYQTVREISPLMNFKEMLTVLIKHWSSTLQTHRQNILSPVNFNTCWVFIWFWYTRPLV